MSEREQGKDLGTYHVRVVFEDGRGFIMSWGTGGRFIGGGTDMWLPLSAKWVNPGYESEEDLIQSIRSMFEEGNYSCDCNKGDFLARANQQPEPDLPCGDTMKIAKLEIINPRGEVVGD